MTAIAYVIACLMASLSFLLNRATLRVFGLQSIIFWSPVLEELVKTVPAFYLGADIWITHVGFGLIEGIYDWRTAGKNGLAAAVFSIGGHGMFGGLTVAGMHYTGSLALGLAPAILTHVAWNLTIIRLAR